VSWRPLDQARVAIHSHRLGALVRPSGAWPRLPVAPRRDAPAAVPRSPCWSSCRLPIGISGAQGFRCGSTAHNAGAAILLLATVALNRTLRPV
jgi:hypothetical protein